MRQIRADSKRTQLCLQTALAEKNHNHFTHRSGEHNKSTPRKKKIITLNVIKKFCMQSRNILTNLSPCPSPTRPEKPAQAYNSAPCQKFHSKSLTCITTQMYLIKMHNGELAKKSRVSPLIRKECPTKLPLMQWCTKRF